MDYSEKVRPYFIFFLVTVVIAAVIFAALITLSLVNDRPYNTQMDIVSLTMNILSIIFIAKIWYEYATYSKKAEAEQEIRKKEWVEKYGDEGEISWFNHKRARKQTIITHSLVILANLGFIIFTLCRWGM